MTVASDSHQISLLPPDAASLLHLVRENLRLLAKLAGRYEVGRLNATVDGQTTAHYITDLLQDANVKVTRLAHGVPVGGELDYLDEGTLAAAIRARKTL